MLCCLSLSSGCERLPRWTIAKGLMLGRHQLTGFRCVAFRASAAANLVVHWEDIPSPMFFSSTRSLPAKRVAFWCAAKTTDSALCDMLTAGGRDIVTVVSERETPVVLERTVCNGQALYPTTAVRAYMATGVVDVMCGAKTSAMWSGGASPECRDRGETLMDVVYAGVSPCSVVTKLRVEETVCRFACC